MEPRVVVAYATKHGSTYEIAQKIGEVLRESGLKVDVLPAEDVAISDYQAVVLGSAVYAGHWRSEAANFLETYEKHLAEMPTWFFSSGPTGEGNPVELMHGWYFPEGLMPIAERIKPRDIVFFHGVLDTEKLGLAEKLIIRGIKAPLGDFRDWESITEWAKTIAHTLQMEPTA